MTWGIWDRGGDEWPTCPWCGHVKDDADSQWSWCSGNDFAVVCPKCGRGYHLVWEPSFSSDRCEVGGELWASLDVPPCC